MQLYAVEPPRRVSVCVVCRQAPVARTTFYAHYDNLDEVLLEIENELVAGLQGLKTGAHDLRSQDALQAHMERVLQFIELHWEENYAFLVSRPNARYVGKWKEAIR